MRFLLLPPSPEGNSCLRELRLLARCIVACFGLLTIWACLWVFYDECFLFVDLLNPDINPYRDWGYLIVGILIQIALGTYCFECVIVTKPTFPPPHIIEAGGPRAWFYRIVQHIRMIVSLFASILCWVGGYGLLQVDDEFESVTWYMRAYVMGGVFLVWLSGTLYPSIDEGWPDEVDLATCSCGERVWTVCRATVGLAGDTMAWVGWDGLLSVDAQVEQVLQDDILMFVGGFLLMYVSRTLPQLVEIDDIDFTPTAHTSQALYFPSSPKDEYEPLGEAPTCRRWCRDSAERPAVRQFMFTFMSVLGYFAWLAAWSGIENIYYWSGFDSPDSDKKTWWIQLSCVGVGVIAMTAARTFAFEA